MSSDGSGDEESGLMESYEDRVFLGECISFFIEGTKTEAQGVVVKILSDVSGTVWFEVNVVQRAPPANDLDIVNKSNQVYRYIDTDELVWIRATSLLCTIPLEFIDDGNGKLSKSLIYDAFPLQMRKLMLYYTKGPGGSVPGLPMQFKLFWWNFDPSTLLNLDWKQRRCPSMNDEDLTSGFICHLKPLIFDPFVSPLSYSHRNPQKHWNIRTWKLLLRNSVEPVPNFDFELEQILLRNASFEMVFKEEIFLSRDCIRIIQVLLKQWMQITHEEMSPYEARTFMMHHDKFVKRALVIITKKKEKEEMNESSGSDDSDLDEHMSFGGEESSSSCGGEDY